MATPPLGEGQAAWTTRALMLLAPLLSFTLVEYLNYNNPWTDFTSLQTALNLAWYYLGELFFYFVLRRRASAVKWAMGDRLGPGHGQPLPDLLPGAHPLSRRLPHPPAPPPTWRATTTTGPTPCSGSPSACSRRCCWPCPSCRTRRKRPLPVAALCPGGRGRRGLSGRVFRHRVCGEPGH